VEKVTVIIGTCNRPLFLREALESVRQQAVLDRIGQVVVSENGGCRESKAVCEQFPDLPICYLFQDPPIPVLFHLRLIWPHVKCPLVAFLHDDDWWDASHLDGALGVLELHPDCTAVYSNCSESYGPQYPAQTPRFQWRVWVASGCDFAPEVVILDPASVTLASLLGSCLHFSTYVGRTPATWTAYERLIETNNDYDTDRSFPIILTSHGNLGYLTRPGVFVRRHSRQQSGEARYQTSGQRIVDETTRWLMRNEADKVARAVEKFNRLVAGLESNMFQLISSQISPGLRQVALEECGLYLWPGPPTVLRKFLRRLKSLVKQVCPPCLWFLTRAVVGGIQVRRHQP
jgi:hypothetical protein